MCACLTNIFDVLIMQEFQYKTETNIAIKFNMIKTYFIYPLMDTIVTGKADSYPLPNKKSST